MQEMRTPGMQKVSLATKSLADYAPVVGPDVVDELVQLASFTSPRPRTAAGSPKCFIRWYR
jgi:hypothetical protein